MDSFILKDKKTALPFGKHRCFSWFYYRTHHIVCQHIFDNYDIYCIQISTLSLIKRRMFFHNHPSLPLAFPRAPHVTAINKRRTFQEALINSALRLHPSIRSSRHRPIPSAALLCAPQRKLKTLTSVYMGPQKPDHRMNPYSTPPPFTIQKASNC